MRDWKRAALALMAIAVVAALCVVALTDGFSKPRREFCSLVGCISGVKIDIGQLPRKLPSARKVEVCVDGQCHKTPVYEAPGGHRPRPYLVVWGRGERLHEGFGPYPVSVMVFDRRGRLLFSAATKVRMDRWYPDGIGCGTPCFDGEARLNVAGHELDALPGGKTQVE